MISGRPVLAETGLPEQLHLGRAPQQLIEPSPVNHDAVAQHDDRVRGGQDIRIV